LPLIDRADISAATVLRKWKRTIKWLFAFGVYHERNRKMTDNITLGQLESILTELLSLVKSKKAEQFRNYEGQVRKLANKKAHPVVPG